MKDLKSIDFKSLITEALDIEKARKTIVSVHVLLDETASPEFQVFVRSGFSSASVNSRLAVGYYPTQDISVSHDTDLVVMAAGQTADTGRIAATIRDAGIPVLIIAEFGNSLEVSAREAGYPIPEESIISLPAGQPLNEEIKGALADRIGTWIIDQDHGKRLAFALAYPFVRRPLAKAAIAMTAAQNAGIGVLVFIPGADMPAMTINQIKMVLQIAAAYGHAIDKDRLKELVPVLAGALLCRGITRKLVSFVPAVGFAIKGGMGYFGTLAIGEATLTYFEQGGDISGLAGVVSQASSAATDAVMRVRDKRAYQVASEAASPVLRRAASKVIGVAGSVAENAAKGAIDNRKRSRRKKRPSK